ncbi:MAG: hypothetical protein Q7T61_16135 [Caulobacter sp.]|nr:hypothetical protein [Caulobacter sp.]
MRLVPTALLTAILALPAAASAQTAPPPKAPPVEGRAMATFAHVCPGWVDGRPTAALLQALDKQGFFPDIDFDNTEQAGYGYRYIENVVEWPLNGVRIEFGAKQGRRYCIVSVFSGDTHTGVLLSHATRWATTMAAPPFALAQARTVVKDADGAFGFTKFTRPGREVLIEDRAPPASKEQFLARKVFSIMLLQTAP